MPQLGKAAVWSQEKTQLALRWFQWCYPGTRVSSESHFVFKSETLTVLLGCMSVNGKAGAVLKQRRIWSIFLLLCSLLYHFSYSLEDHIFYQVSTGRRWDWQKLPFPISSRTTHLGSLLMICIWPYCDSEMIWVPTFSTYHLMPVVGLLSLSTILFLSRKFTL